MSDAYLNIGVIGAGAMGRGIAQVFAQAGADVTLVDQAQQALDAAQRSVSAGLDRMVAKGRLDATDASAALARISLSQSISALAGCDLVIEAIVEKLDPKVAVLRQAAQISPRAVLASNTSSLQISDMSERLAGPNPVIGLHFFNPAPVMRLVEVVTLPDTPPNVADSVTRTLRNAGKHPVICADTPGFIVNRCARPFYGEALAILAEQVHSAAQIDAAMTASGYRLGPFALIDLIGADVHLAATEGVAAGFDHHPRYHIFAALRAQVADGRLGRKTGSGFVTPASDAGTPADASAIVRRIEVMLANEAATLWAGGHVSRADIDISLKLGLNFPAGPYEIASKMGFDRLENTLFELQNLAPENLKRRYEPAPALSAFAAG